VTKQTTSQQRCNETNLKFKRRSQAPVTQVCNPSYFRRQRAGGSGFEASPGKIVPDTLPQKKKLNNKKELVKWLNVYALSSNPSAKKKERKSNKCTRTTKAGTSGFRLFILI
jgi:hypothetical protein